MEFIPIGVGLVMLIVGSSLCVYGIIQAFKTQGQRVSFPTIIYYVGFFIALAGIFLGLWGFSLLEEQPQ